MKKDAASNIAPLAELKPRRVLTEMRLGKRVDIRQGDGITADLYIDDQFIPVRLWDITTLGACVIAGPEVSLPANCQVKMRLNFSWGESVVSTYEVCWIRPASDGNKFGLRIAPSAEGVTLDSSVQMLQITSAYPVTGYLYSIVHYQERSIFRLVSLSRTHVLLDIMDEEHLFFERQEIELLFSLESNKSDRLKGRIIQIVHVKKESIRILIEITPGALTPSLEGDLVSHLILDPTHDLEKIRHAGFPIRHVANSFRFRFVKTQEDYEQVLKLRFEAYAFAGKTAPGATVESMVAPLDHVSRILIAFHGDKVVASVAMSFPNSEDVILDTERPLANGYSKDIPKKTEMIEIARLCTNPNYRRGDLLLRMFEHIYKVFATSDRKYLISSTDKKLWPIYKNLGFKKMGLKYAHPYLAGLEHEIILIDILVPVTGAEIGFWRWLYLYSGMTEFVEVRRKLERKGAGKARFLVFKFAANTLKMWSRIRKK